MSFGEAMTTADDFYGHYSLTGKAGWYERLGPLRQAIIRCDGPAVIQILKARCSIDPEDPGACWLWKGAVRAGYGYIGRKETNRLAHRVVLEAARSFIQEIGGLSVHHKCGIRLCGIPEHLVLATHAENTAEMLGRRAYLQRIADLEGALRVLAPGHLLLAKAPRPLLNDM
ncbi:HNH endonuclease signature motif containing protein [Arthrobacter sp. ES3-54]|uniref:HNH endonuclease signature motif containing protein n=1 Tax=Arthrobacter sp. ES3-54 TaxID=1502991 RepID=UPI0024074847|nr:HNH endonuclease signature motif containing protein [Arthrobacter sp. ES3-54]MDF9749072.1 hypothetical protein [Arthrobacter sp. ES3-54]